MECYDTPRATTRTRLALYAILFSIMYICLQQAQPVAPTWYFPKFIPLSEYSGRSANSKFYGSRSEMNCAGGIYDVGLYERLDSMLEPHWSAKGF